MTTAGRPPVLDQLDRALQRALARDETSPARARQLRWVAGELRRALDTDGFPEQARDSLTDLFKAAPSPPTSPSPPAATCAPAPPPAAPPPPTPASASAWTASTSSPAPAPSPSKPPNAPPSPNPKPP
ncbi:hypothetical protein ACU686_34805 [Yinghuangia aomiensis]